MKSSQYGLFIKILLLLMVFSSKINAQNADLNNFGMVVGISHNNVFDHITGAQFDSRFNYILAGIFYHHKINSNKNSIKHELEYIHKGSYRFDINYLIISSMWSRRICRNNSFNVLLGPYVGYMFRYIGRGRVRNFPETKDYDYGMNFGVDFRIADNIPIVISPRLELGLLRFSFSKHRVIEFKIGWIFNANSNCEKDNKKRRRRKN